MIRRGASEVAQPTATAEPWKVVRVIARLNVGGPARHVMILTDRLPALGFESLLVFGRVANGEATLEDGVAACRGRSLKIPELGRHIHLWDDLRAAWRLWGVLRRERPDVIHTHTSKAGVLGRLLGAACNLFRPRSQRALIVHTFHGHIFAGYFGPIASRLVRWTERALATVTDVIVAISERQREDLVETYRIAKPSAVHIVPLGLEIDPLLRLERPDPQGAACDGKPITFAFLGRLVPIKDLPTLIDAFALAAGQAPNVRLHLFGGGELRSALETRAQTLGIADRVTFAGWQLSLPEIYAGLDVVVLTSRSEGTPVAIIEAQAAGLPVVATDVGGVGDVMRPGLTGLLAPSGDPSAIAEALLRLAASPDLRWRLGMAGRAWVRERYSAERLANDVNRLYREGLARKRGLQMAETPPVVG